MGDSRTTEQRPASEQRPTKTPDPQPQPARQTMPPSDGSNVMWFID